MVRLTFIRILVHLVRTCFKTTTMRNVHLLELIMVVNVSFDVAPNRGTLQKRGGRSPYLLFLGWTEGERKKKRKRPNCWTSTTNILPDEVLMRRD